jgi:hypothetical protein
MRLTLDGPDNAQRLCDAVAAIAPAERSSKTPVAPKEPAMATLDEMFPNLGRLVQRVLGMSLEGLASRAPAVGFQFYDLERLLATVRANEASPLDELCTAIYGAHRAQDRGYIATIDAFIGLGAIRDEQAFVEKKLMAPRMPRTQHNSSEMMDTVVECSWGLWLNDEHGTSRQKGLFLTAPAIRILCRHKRRPSLGRLHFSGSQETSGFGYRLSDKESLQQMA